MGLFNTTPSSIETVDGRVRFEPAPPDPRWMRVAEAVTWIGPPVLVALSIVSGDVDTLTIVIGALWALGVLSLIAGRLARRGAPPSPTEPFDVPEPLLAEVRELAEAGRDVEAMRTVRETLGVGLVDARKIVDVAVGRIR